MSLAIDLTRLPPNAVRILAPNAPPALRLVAARGIVPGLRPADVLAVVLLLSQGEDEVAEQARMTMESLPTPLVNGALSGNIDPAVLDAVGLLYARDAHVAERVVLHPGVLVSTIVAMAETASELVCELIATNEERLLASPEIIEKLYLNRDCRMSTADRILELAVRNGIELKIPAFAQAKLAIAGELIAEPTTEASFDDAQFAQAQSEAEAIRLEGDEDTHTVDEETGEETVVEKAKPLHAIWATLRGPAKIRLLNLTTLKVYNKQGRIIDEMRFDQKALRGLGIRDANPFVAVAAINTPGVSDAEVTRIAAMRNVAEEVLREIANNREWTRHYMVKYNLVANPRTSFGYASRFILHLRDSELKSLTKSRDVSQAVQIAAKQQLQRKGKKN